MYTSPSILVIDDEPDNFDVIDALLEREGYQLHYIANAQHAFEFVASCQPDVILLDVMMPNMNGIEFCQRFKANPEWQSIPVLMVTALTAKEDLAQCFAAGANDFISKPINGLELRARVRSMLSIKQQYDLLQQTLQLRTDLSNMIVHDLRNPLSVVLFAAENLQRFPFSPERQQQKTNQIIIAGQQLQAMIDSLLLMAKLESGKMTLYKTEIDLYALCESAIADMEAIANQKEVKLRAILPKFGDQVSVDIPVFRRVLDNLLSNAIKFAPEQSEVVLQAESLPSGRSQIQVIDSGPGVKKELRQSIFEKYEIGTLKQGIAQIGLGLAFCKIAVEAHGGTIEVENNEPQGTIFKIEV